MKPLVSVVITTYNSASSVERVLKSIFNQSYENIEILIFDDASTDNTKNIIEKVLTNKNFRSEYFFSKKNNGGPAKGRNWGIVNSRGKYICFCDADDEWLPEKLKIQLDFLENNNFAFCGTRCNVIGSKQYPEVSGPVSIKSQLRRNKFSLSTLMVKSECVKDNIMFDERIEYHAVEDFDLILKLYSLGYIGFVINSKLVNYYYSLTSLSHLNLKKSELKRILILRNFKCNNIFIMVYVKSIILLLKTRLKSYGVRNYFSKL